ncbi:DUF421 domain-containing protein [Cytobacillus sp. Hz8]|uniref:DUF421 domain-containing protein n=1 Tax=Cytobacillus sp. Hz8 TaxID=3347168 RepID=UPI0035D8AA94
MNYLNIFVDLVIGYFALFIAVKFLGKTQINQITPFDFISALVLGDLVGNAIFDRHVGPWKIIFAIVVWALLIFFTEIATQKSRTLRLLFEGKASIIIEKGKINWKEMKKNRLDIDQLKQLLRSKDVFSLREVEYAIFENNGGISVLRKPESEYHTLQDFKTKGEEKVIPLTIISDGDILYKNLKEAGLNEEWLYKELLANGVSGPKEICYAEWQPGKSIYFQQY